MITVKQYSSQWDVKLLPFLSRSSSFLLTDQDTERGNKKKDKDAMRRSYIKEKGYKTEEMWECEWWQKIKINDQIKNNAETNIP